jgi:hypothetical protein
MLSRNIYNYVSYLRPGGQRDGFGRSITLILMRLPISISISCSIERPLSIFSAIEIVFEIDIVEQPLSISISISMTDLATEEEVDRIYGGKNGILLLRRSL